MHQRIANKYNSSQPWMSEWIMTDEQAWRHAFMHGGLNTVSPFLHSMSAFSTRWQRKEIYESLEESKELELFESNKKYGWMERMSRWMNGMSRWMKELPDWKQPRWGQPCFQHEHKTLSFERWKFPMHWQLHEGDDDETLNCINLIQIKPSIRQSDAKKKRKPLSTTTSTTILPQVSCCACSCCYYYCCCCCWPLDLLLLHWCCCCCCRAPAEEAPCVVSGWLSGARWTGSSAPSRTPARPWRPAPGWGPPSAPGCSCSSLPSSSTGLPPTCFSGLSKEEVSK